MRFKQELVIALSLTMAACGKSEPSSDSEAKGKDPSDTAVSTSEKSTVQSSTVNQANQNKKLENNEAHFTSSIAIQPLVVAESVLGQSIPIVSTADACRNLTENKPYIYHRDSSASGAFQFCFADISGFSSPVKIPGFSMAKTSDGFAFYQDLTSGTPGEKVTSIRFAPATSENMIHLFVLSQFKGKTYCNHVWKLLDFNGRNDNLKNMQLGTLPCELSGLGYKLSADEKRLESQGRATIEFNQMSID